MDLLSLEEEDDNLTYTLEEWDKMVGHDPAGTIGMKPPEVSSKDVFIVLCYVVLSGISNLKLVWFFKFVLRYDYSIVIACVSLPTYMLKCSKSIKSSIVNVMGYVRLSMMSSSMDEKDSKMM